MARRLAGFAAVVLVASILGGCASGSPIAEDAGLGGPVGEVAAPFPTAEPARVVVQPVHAEPQVGYVVEARSPSQRPYTLDTGDKLRVFVYGQPNLSRLYTVDQSGKISIPLIGNVRARGLTTVSLEGAIRGRLAQGLVRDPQVTVDVQQNRPFFILGEVRAPGQYPYVTGMTAEMAVAIAGGFGERANERKVRLSRRSGGFNEMIDVPTDAEIEPGDTVYVYERFF